MRQRFLSILSILILLFCLLTIKFNKIEVKASNGYTVHNLNTGLNYTSIQAAIDANETLPGHTIFVDAGTYYEHISVSKPLFILGESKDSTIIDGNGTGTVVVVSSNSSEVSNLTIRNSGESQSYGLMGARYGILLINVSNCTLANDIITNNSIGVFLESSSYNTFKNNSITMNRYNFGVLGLELSHYIQDVDDSNLIDGKPICYWVNHNGEESPSEAGFIALVNSTNIMVKNLNLKNNYEGVLLAYTRNSTITNCTVVSSLHGITIFFSSNDTILNNNVTGEPNYGVGIGLGASSNSTVLGNTVRSSMYGISLGALSSNNTVSRNRIANNSLEGIELLSSSRNIVLNNTIENNGESGIEFYYDCFDNMVMNNTITNNKCGIDLSIGPSSNTFSGNVIANNKDFGVSLLRSSNNTFLGNNITNNNCYGVALYDLSNYNTFCRNNIINNTMYGVSLYQSSNNAFFENNIANSKYGVYPSGSNNEFYHNNFKGNMYSTMPGGANIWDDGYPSGGNYWSSYTGVDSDHDGIGDSWYEIDSNNIDHYPLMGTFSDFKATYEHHVQMICNSSISDFQFNGTAISFDVTGDNGTSGFCRICIPTALMNVTYKVFVNGTEISYNLLPCSNETNSYLYFNYTHSTQEVIIIREFPSFLILPLFMTATLLAIIVYKRKHALTLDKG